MECKACEIFLTGATPRRISAVRSAQKRKPVG